MVVSENVVFSFHQFLSKLVLELAAFYRVDRVKLTFPYEVKLKEIGGKRSNRNLDQQAKAVVEASDIAKCLPVAVAQALASLHICVNIELTLPTETLILSSSD